MKTDEGLNEDEQKEKMPGATHEHVQAIVQRLTAPKRLYKLR
jgi:hypothetical protein